MFLAISVILFWGHATATSSAQCNQLVAVTECVCPGQTVIYRCSVMGGIFTVYDGTAFQLCSLGEITLSNNAFGTANNPIRSCGGQLSITGMGLSNSSNCFTSQINVMLRDSGGAGRMISCGVDDGSGAVVPVGTTTLAISTEGFTPPNVSLAAGSPGYITFTWDPVSQNCPSLYYNITSQDCGTCPNRTDSTSINCTDFSEALARDGELACVFSVQTVICGGTSAVVGGNLSSISVALKVPSPPNLLIIPYYSGDGQLKGFDANITLTDPVPMSDSFDGSANLITFTFLNVDTNDMCQPKTEIQVSDSCVGVVFSHYLSVNQMCSNDSTQTGITVYASNILGNGISSKAVISNKNDFVRITFTPSLTTNPRTGSVDCLFLAEVRDSGITCEISIQGGDNIPGQIQSKNVVQIIFNIDDGVTELSYNITASNVTHQVVVQDSRTLQSPNQNTNIGAIIAGVVTVSAAILLILSILFMVVTVKLALNNRVAKKENEDLEKENDELKEKCEDLTKKVRLTHSRRIFKLLKW